MAKKHIFPVFVPHAGCPCQCVFCNQRAIAGQAAPVTPQEVAKQVQAAFLARGHALELAFYGGSFTAIEAGKQEALLEAAAYCRKAGWVSGVRLSTRPDAVGEDVLRRLARFGVETVELGAQSMEDDVLRQSGRGHTARDTADAVHALRTYGFSVVLQLMAGLPGDSPALCVQSARKAALLQPDGVRIYPVAVLPDTALHAMYLAGTYTPLSVPQAASVCADMLEVFEEEGIAVLRVGLQPEEGLGAAVCAGAYHPAMGELAWGEVFTAASCGSLRLGRGKREEP